jgi:hypothetical protein
MLPVLGYDLWERVVLSLHPAGSPILIVVSLLIPMPISTLLAPAMTGLDIRLQACFQVSRSTALEGQRQIAARIAVYQLSVGSIVGHQELSMGEQLLDLAIAKDLLRRD